MGTRLLQLKHKFCPLVNGLRLLVSGLAKHMDRPFMNQLALTGFTHLTWLPSSPPKTIRSIDPKLTAAADVFTNIAINRRHHHYQDRHQYHHSSRRTTLPCLSVMQLLKAAPVLGA